MIKTIFVSLFFVTATLAKNRFYRKNSVPSARDFKIINESGATIDIFWINPDTHKRSESNLESPLVYGGDSGISSFIGHSFEVEEQPNTKGKCMKGRCRKAYFTVKDTEEQIVYILKDFLIDISDQTTRAAEKAKRALTGCTFDAKNADAKQLEQLTTCLEQKVNSTINETRQEIEFEMHARKVMGNKLTSYACSQTQKLETSPAIQNRTWNYLNTQHDVKILFQSDYSALSLIENVLSEEQCNAILKHASAPSTLFPDMTLLGLASRSDPFVDSAMAKISNLMSTFFSRTFAYDTKDPMLYLITQQQQTTDAAAAAECELDQDGACVPETGVTASTNVRVQSARLNEKDAASLRIVCKVPNQGGALHYPQAGAHIVPTLGMAVLSVFFDADTGKTDEDPFLEELVECPVLKGSLVTVRDNFQFSV